MKSKNIEKKLEDYRQNTREYIHNLRPRKIETADQNKTENGYSYNSIHYAYPLMIYDHLCAPLTSSALCEG